MSTQVVVVTDDRFFSDGLIERLSIEPDITATSRDVTAAPDHETSGADVVLLDVRANALTGSTQFPAHPAVVLVAAPDDDVWAIGALSRGARGILTKAAAAEEMIAAVRVVRTGGIWARRRWLNECVSHLVTEAARRLSAEHDIGSRLSPREREVLELAASGVGNKELAGRLYISEATVKAHLTQIFRKLGVTGRAALAAAYHDVSTVAAAPRVVRLAGRKINPFAN